MSQWWRILVVLLTASSMLGASTAAIVHVQEHSLRPHDSASCTQATPKKQTHSGCRHHHHRHDPSQPNSPSQHPSTPHSHDNCSLCHFLMEHPLPPDIIELPLTETVAVFCVSTPCIQPVEAAVELPPARGPPSLG